jgi:hypothetical protein
MTKSPTEAELVGLACNVGMVELFEEFVCFYNNEQNLQDFNKPGLYSSCQLSY